MQKLVHYIRKIHELGPRKTTRVVLNRAQAALFYHRSKQAARTGTAHHTWQKIQQRHGIRSMPFSTFWDTLCKRHLPLPPHIFDRTDLLPQANAYAANTFDLLGSGPIIFTDIPWHQDFRLHQQNPQVDATFDADMFYHDLPITVHNDEDFGKDIKVPWELSRFYQAGVLGAAYQKTGDATYTHAWQEQVTSWLSANNYLCGANWVCPMEVGIRATNWVHALQYFKHANGIETTFWQRYICSLYDHFVYLENNWEVYDTKTSNHYFADLVGYIYLCFLFYDLPGVQKKAAWCYQEIIIETRKQVLPDGSDYEGSTAYHRLVAEMVMHTILVCKALGYDVTELEETFKHMQNFLAWCSYAPGHLVHIGDNDSGIITWPGLNIPSAHNKDEGIQKTFPDFGLSIINTNNLHFTLRTASYNPRQPSGHFHNDTLSITYAVDGLLLIADPGSFIYTPSAKWRNAFRSVSAHNTFFLEGHEPIPFDERLFALNMQEGTTSCYQLYNLVPHREFEFNEQQKTITLTDWWEQKNPTSTTPLPPTVWNFTLAHNVTATPCKGGITLLHNNTPYAHILSDDITFTTIPGWISYSYGSKIATTALRAQCTTDLTKKVSITFISCK